MIGGKDQLIRKRIRLAGSISHYRLMIRCNYHPEFFNKLLVKTQVEQRDILQQERKLDRR